MLFASEMYRRPIYFIPDLMIQRCESGTGGPWVMGARPEHSWATPRVLRMLTAKEMDDTFSRMAKTRR